LKRIPNLHDEIDLFGIGQSLDLRKIGNAHEENLARFYPRAGYK
jgi:hypothetical protein